MLARALTLVVVPLLSIAGLEVWNMTVHLRYKSAPASGTQTMRAVRYSRHGGRDVLHVVEDAARPLVPALPGMLVVKVAGAALNPVDFKMRRNAQPDALIPKPKIPGCDVSGTVVDAGKGAHGFVVGDKVFGMLPIVGSPWGGLAEYVAAEASVFAKAPESIPLEHAAALPLVGLTVMQVAEQAGLVPAKRQGPPQGAALVQAASGGVGTFAVQYLRNVLNFADVLGTTSAANTEMVKSLGVTQAIDYRTETFESAAAKAGGVDVVLDPMAWSYMDRTLPAAVGGKAQSTPNFLRPGAKYLHIMSSDWADNDAERDARTAFMGPLLKWKARVAGFLSPALPKVYSSAVQPSGEALARLSAYVDAGLIKPVIDQTFDGLDAAVEAFAYLETGHAKGKVLVRVDKHVTKQGGASTSNNV